MPKRLLVCMLLGAVVSGLICGCSKKEPKAAQPSRNPTQQQQASEQPDGEQPAAKPPVVELTEFQEWFASSLKIVGQSPGFIIKEMGREPNSLDESFGGLVWTYKRKFETGVVDVMTMTIDFNRRNDSGIMVSGDDPHPIARRIRLDIQMVSISPDPLDKSLSAWETYVVALRDWSGSVKECLQNAGLAACLDKTPSFMCFDQEKGGLGYKITYDKASHNCCSLVLTAVSAKPTIAQKMNSQTGRYESTSTVTTKDLLGMTVTAIEFDKAK